jgi:proline dehydrogenase
VKFLYPLAKRFIAGYNLESASGNIQRLMDEGYEVSIDYVGEDSKTQGDCLRAFQQYVKIIKFYKNKKIDISIKPSQLGLNIHPILSYSHISNLARLAKEYGHTIRLDMEGSKVTELTRNLAITLNGRFGNVGIAIQANLYRTNEDINSLMSKGVSIRLVKGAYKENKKIAYQDCFGIGAAFFDYAARLYANKANKPAIATHDEELLEDIELLVPNPDYFEYEFLYGIRRDLQKDLKDKGYTVRVYVPFGKKWLPYTLRRLKEWKNLSFVVKNIFHEIFKR